MPTPRDVSEGAPERFRIADCGERWLEFLALEHETLLPATDFLFSDGDLLVRRAPPVGRRIADGRVPRSARAALFLQAAAAIAFFGARGFPLSSDDLADGVWEGAGPEARLWLTRTPRSVAAPPASEMPACRTLLAALRFLFAGESGRLSPSGARELAASLAAPEAAWKRGEHWVASALRQFAELGDAAAASARQRCLGFGQETVRDPRRRALAEKARAILRGKAPRIFEAGASVLTPGGALRLVPPAAGRSDAVRRLRELATPRNEGQRPPVWIAVEPETWDDMSRSAVEAARLAAADSLEVIVVSAAPPSPASPAEWRRAAWVPCGSLAGSIRFYEWLAGAAPPDPLRARAMLRRTVGDPAWAAFAGDPTGDAPLPPMGPEEGAVPTRDARRRRSDSGLGADPGVRIERLLEEGRIAGALIEGERWVSRFPDRPPEAWFPLSARLAACGAPLPGWLEALEAEREIAGGRTADARSRLERIVRSGDADPGLRRRAHLRSAEVLAMQGQPADAARRAAEWRRMHPSAPASEAVRALRLGAAGFSREGRVDCALALLDEAERLGAGLSPEEAVETALVRARVYALSGRFEEESAIYETVRSTALRSGDDRLAARFLAQEARGLLDRREPERATVRFEEAMAIAADPAERATLALDLAATLYHSGREEDSDAALRKALEAAALAGREDLVRIARGNRVELLVNRGAWDAAAAEVSALTEAARAENDAPRLLVALHHSSRLALRRGFLADAERENAEARRIGEAIGDRLEVGELWLEDGDRRLYEGDVDGAMASWERAAGLPEDRSDRERTARGRIAEAAWRAGGGPPDEAWRTLEASFRRDAYRASETVARWQRLFGPARIPASWRDRAIRCLRESGGADLAARVFGTPGGEVRSESLRPLRDALLAVLAGDAPHLDGALARLGVEGLAVRDADGRPVIGLGILPPASSAWHPVEAGAARFDASLWPAPEREILSAVLLLLETVLFRPGSREEAPPDHVRGWRRLGIVTGDASMEEPYSRLARFAPQDVTVVVLGESGSGKEAVARAIHGLSARAAGAFAAVNVAAIPHGVLESELFGHARGAFTGADRDRRGLLEEASGGTIFFDEIGDLDLPLQAKLLRALQERELRRVGENRSRSIDLRVVSATSRDLTREVECGRFREDLFYRLHVAVIRLPPLRERGRDAILLARHFLDRFAREYGKSALTLAPETVAAIGAYAWPGNVRELQNAMAQAAALSDPAAVVTVGLLPEAVRPARAPAARTGGYRARVDAHRRDLIADALDRAGGNRSRAARDLGLSRQALLYLIKELKVEVRRS